MFTRDLHGHPSSIFRSFRSHPSVTRLFDLASFQFHFRSITATRPPLYTTVYTLNPSSKIAPSPRGVKSNLLDSPQNFLTRQRRKEGSRVNESRRKILARRTGIDGGNARRRCTEETKWEGKGEREGGSPRRSRSRNFARKLLSRTEARPQRSVVLPGSSSSPVYGRM